MSHHPAHAAHVLMHFHCSCLCFAAFKTKRFPGWYVGIIILAQLGKTNKKTRSTKDFQDFKTLRVARMFINNIYFSPACSFYSRLCSLWTSILTFPPSLGNLVQQILVAKMSFVSVFQRDCCKMIHFMIAHSYCISRFKLRSRSWSDLGEN